MNVQGRAAVARRIICQPFEAHPRMQQPQYHHQTLGLCITLPSTQQPEGRTERSEPQRSNGAKLQGRQPSYDDDEFAFLGDDNEEGYGSDSDMEDEEDATSSISSGRDSMFYGGSSGSGSEEGDELQHQQLGESVPGIGSFYVRRDQVLRRRRRDFVKLKRSQKAKIVKTAYSVIEAVCETFFPGERMELLDAITGAHKTYRRRHQNNLLLVGSNPNTTITSSSIGRSSIGSAPMVWGKKQQNASPPCTPPALAILRAPGTRRTRASSMSMVTAEETRNPDPEPSSFSSSGPMDRTMTRSAATAAGNTSSSSSSSSGGWHRQAGGWGGFPSSTSSSSSSSFGRPYDLVRGQGRALDMNMEWEGGVMKKSSSTSSVPSFTSSSASSPSSSSSMFSSSQEPIQPMQSYVVPPVHVVAAGATAAGRTSVPPSSSWSTPRTAVSPLPFSSSLPSSSSPRVGAKRGAAEQEDVSVPEEAWILHGLRFAAGGIIECQMGRREGGREGGRART